MITVKQKQLLQHMLGADERYKKKQWGFRNHFCTGGAETSDHKELLVMEELGLVKSGNKLGSCVFWATKKGALAVGFKPYQLRNTQLA